MPLLNLVETKTLLQITVSTFDTLIEMLIPVVEKSIVKYCNNEFIGTYESIQGIMPTVYTYSSTISFANSDNSMNDAVNDFTETSFKANDVVRVYNSLNNEGMFTIDSVAAHKIIFNSLNTVNDEDLGNTFVIARVDFPEELKFTAARMIKWGMQKYGMFKSETIDNYSYTLNGGLVGGYPRDIMSGLDDYRSLYKKSIPYNILYYRLD